MSCYTRLPVVMIASVLLSLLIFLKLTSTSFEEELEFVYPIGSFDVHMFFDQHWHSL